MINVAIDGPAGAGKSTVARGAAKELGYIYVDTGALYRAVGVYSLRKNIDTKDAEAVSATLDDIKVDIKFIDGQQHVFLNDDDVSEEIRLPEASMAASNVSAIPAVRAFLFDLQRDIASKNNCLMDGRDIGTVVL
ncbi:MAG: (d)CMP kinase, partial [Clostridia bacterium]|nr:(d)CMP kinase [Clostridia bacterium]